MNYKSINKRKICFPKHIKKNRDILWNVIIHETIRCRIKRRNPQTGSEHTLFLKHSGTVKRVMQHIIRLAYFIPQDTMIYVPRKHRLARATNRERTKRGTLPWRGSQGERNGSKWPGVAPLSSGQLRCDGAYRKGCLLERLCSCLTEHREIRPAHMQHPSGSVCVCFRPTLHWLLFCVMNYIYIRFTLH